MGGLAYTIGTIFYGLKVSTVTLFGICLFSGNYFALLAIYLYLI